MGVVEGLRDLLSSWDDGGAPLSGQAIRRGIGGLQLRRRDVADWISFSEVSYQRIVLHRGDGYEALLICWRSGQRSPIHDHAGSFCGVRIVEGTATETVFAMSPCGQIVPTRSRVHESGAVSVSRDAEIHQMANLAPAGQDLITLHVYSPPLSGTRIYSIGETTLADHDGLAASRPRDLNVSVRLRLDGIHAPTPSTPRRVIKVKP